MTKIKQEIKNCMYCNNDCEYNDKIEHNNYLCDGYEGDIDNLYNTNKQQKTKITKTEGAIKQ
jgi:hypothetical protein